MARSEVGKLNVAIEASNAKLDFALKQAEQKVKKTAKVIEKDSKLEVFNSALTKALGAFAALEFALRGLTAGMSAYNKAIKEGKDKTDAYIDSVLQFASAIPVVSTLVETGRAIGNVFGAEADTIEERESVMRASARSRKLAARARQRTALREGLESLTLATQFGTALEQEKDPEQRAILLRERQLIGLERQRDKLAQQAENIGFGGGLSQAIDKLNRQIEKLANSPLVFDAGKDGDTGFKRALRAQQESFVEAQNKVFFGSGNFKEQQSRGAFSAAINPFQIAGRPGEDRTQKAQLDELKKIAKNTSSQEAFATGGLL